MPPGLPSLDVNGIRALAPSQGFMQMDIGTPPPFRVFPEAVLTATVNTVMHAMLSPLMVRTALQGSAIFLYFTHISSIL